ncbi:MAG: ribonuclease III [Ruminococcaceae bacterium]|nr:ribonuclease III [Oscillospiraceae bacterium]
MLPINEISTPALAYLGDCVIEMMVRERLVRQGIAKSGHLNAAALRYVKASAQAEAMRRILEALTEEEMRIYKRGRNSGHLKAPKSAGTAEYRMASGMEVLFGHLHLTDQRERAEALFALAYPLETAQAENEA